VPPQDRDDDDDEKTEPAAGATQSLEVQFSSTTIPTVSADKDDRPADRSQSIDVQFSGPRLPRAKTHDAAPRRPRSRTVPGMIAESLSNLPVVKEVMPRSRRGRVLVRSVIVGFALVATWIGVIVYWQLRNGEKPDFRPQVEAILIAMRDGRATEVYDHSSTRFQEMVLEDTFVAQVADMNESLGDFVEVASVVDTHTFRGPSGRTARVQLLLEFINGRARASMSFLFEDAQWRMIGFDVSLPPDVAKAQTSEEARKKRVQAPKEIEELTRTILEESRDGKAGQIWDQAAAVFRGSISRDDFIALEQRRRDAVGPFLRILKVTSRQNPSGTAASLDALVEFNAGEGSTVTIAGSFKYAKIEGIWRLAFYKLILPMPHGGEKLPP
jgi:hypothetical protein